MVNEIGVSFGVAEIAFDRYRLGRTSRFGSPVQGQIELKRNPFEVERGYGSSCVLGEGPESRGIA